MATGEIVQPREIVKAHNDLFRCKYKIKDVVACRIFMAFASLVDNKDVQENQSFVEYKISANSILPETCDGGDNYKQLQDAARMLIDQKVEQHKHDRHFKYYTLFSTIEYENGIIRGEFHRDLVPFFIIAKERFTKLKLQEYMNLSSIYSQCIFGFLKSWDDKNEINVKISEFHEMLDTPPSFRKNFAEFKRRILDKAHKDINDKTSLSYEWEPIKTGRSFSEIKFKFIKKEPTGKRAQIGKIPQSILAVEAQENKVQTQLTEFCEKFKDGKINHLKAGIKWYGMNKNGIAPLANDVPKDNRLSVLEFLEQWEASHSKNES